MSVAMVIFNLDSSVIFYHKKKKHWLEVSKQGECRNVSPGRIKNRDNVKRKKFSRHFYTILI